MESIVVLILSSNGFRRGIYHSGPMSIFQWFASSETPWLQNVLVQKHKISQMISKPLLFPGHEGRQLPEVMRSLVYMCRYASLTCPRWRISNWGYSHLLIAHVLRAVVGAQAGATSAPSDSAWIRRHLSDSIYLWACGEKADDEDEEPKLSDKLVGWLILFVRRSGWPTY